MEDASAGLSKISVRTGETMTFAMSSAPPVHEAHTVFWGFFATI